MITRAFTCEIMKLCKFSLTMLKIFQTIKLELFAFNSSVDVQSHAEVSEKFDEKIFKLNKYIKRKNKN